MTNSTMLSTLCVACALGMGPATSTSEAQVGVLLKVALRKAAPFAGQVLTGVAVDLVSTRIAEAMAPEVKDKPIEPIVKPAARPPSEPPAPPSQPVVGQPPPVQTDRYTSEQLAPARAEYAAFNIEFISPAGFDQYTGLAHVWQQRGVLIVSGNQGFMRIFVALDGVTVGQVVEEDAFVWRAADGSLQVQTHTVRGAPNYAPDNFWLVARGGTYHSGLIRNPDGSQSEVHATFLGVGRLPGT